MSPVGRSQLERRAGGSLAGGDEGEDQDENNRPLKDAFHDWTFWGRKENWRSERTEATEQKITETATGG
jgi:hypothetical protein